MDGAFLDLNAETIEAEVRFSAFGNDARRPSSLYNEIIQ